MWVTRPSPSLCLRLSADERRSHSPPGFHVAGWPVARKRVHLATAAATAAAAASYSIPATPAAAADQPGIAG